MPSERRSGDAVRADICRYVIAHPGAHFRDIQRGMHLSPGQAMHHLRKLLDSGLLVERRISRYTHYFPSTVPAAMRNALGAVRHPSRRALVEAVHVRGAASMAELACELPCAPSTLHHHLKVLTEAGVLVPTGSRPARFVVGPGVILPASIAALPKAVPAVLAPVAIPVAPGWEPLPAPPPVPVSA
jgi:DNA-binding transcriptional ArsR family regulator